MSQGDRNSFTGRVAQRRAQELVDQAFMIFTPTPKAKPRIKDQETSGMVLKAAVPVFDENKKLLGVLYGGHLLNSDYRIVDRIKDIVYRGVKYKGKDTGQPLFSSGM